MREPVTVACAQLEPVVLDRDATIEKLAAGAAEAAGKGAQLAVFPEAFVPAYPSSTWAKALAGWSDDGAKEAFALFAREAVEIPGPAERRLGEIAREHELWLVTGVTERDPARPGTLYNTLLYHSPEGTLALKHRKLVPTNHERLVWGPGDGSGLETIETPLGRIGGLICWENYMPLARTALYAQGVDVYLAPTWDNSDVWVPTLRHIAREGRTYVIGVTSCIRAADLPADLPGRAALYHDPASGDGGGDRGDWLSRGNSAIIGPGGEVLAGPLIGEEGILCAEIDARQARAGRQQFDPIGHYGRSDVFRLHVDTSPRPAVVETSDTSLTQATAAPQNGAVPHVAAQHVAAQNSE